MEYQPRKAGNRPLALTLGEPAGIGPDIALAAWLRRDELKLPPFYLLGDAAFIARRAKALGLEVPVADVGAAEACAAFAQALPVAATGKHATAEPGKPDTSSADAAISLDPPRGRRRRGRACQRRRHQSDREKRALSRGVRASRPHRIPRRARRRERQDAAARHDAVVARACSRAGDDSPLAARGDRAALDGLDRQHGADRGGEPEEPLRSRPPPPRAVRAQPACRRRRLARQRRQGDRRACGRYPAQ